MNDSLSIEVRDSLASIDAGQWNALQNDGNPFLQHAFLHALESTGCLGQATGWYPRYFLLWDGTADTDRTRRLMGGAPAYVKTNSHGEFVFDWAWADAYQRNQMPYYPKLVSSIPFTPVTGRRLLVHPDQPYEETVKLLASAMRQFSLSEEYSSVHFLFLTEQESDILSAQPPVPSQHATTDPDSADGGATGEPSKEDEDEDEEAEAEADVDVDIDVSGTISLGTATDHLKRIDCQFHWHNNAYSSFEDFLAQCTSKRRKTIRRERRFVSDANLRLERRSGDTLSEQEWNWVHGFYESTFDRKWGSPSLTRGFFKKIGSTFGEHVLIVFAYDPDDDLPEEPVACSVMFVGGGTLYGRYWGCRVDHHSLHFEACYYQGIDYCIENGVQHFEPGAQGEHKITRGFVPTITRSAHYIAHPGFRDAIGRFLAEETPHVQQRCEGLTDLLPFKSDTLSL